jgi:hypothetical protein
MTPFFKYALTFAGAVAALTLVMAVVAHAGAPPLPKPLTATIVGVCEGGAPKLMVAVFTYADGKVLVADGKHMQGFEDATAIVKYASTATSVNEYAQQCAGSVIKGGPGSETL